MTTLHNNDCVVHGGSVRSNDNVARTMDPLLVQTSINRAVRTMDPTDIDRSLINRSCSMDDGFGL